MTIEIIAELAQGFEGRPELARLLLKAAAASGADAAKYQLVFADELATPDYKYYELFKSLEMSDQVWKDLASFASELGIRLNLDIFGERSLALAEELGVSAVKLHGTDIANLGLLNVVAESGINKVLLGAGGAHADEITAALEILVQKDVVLLLGFQGYPTPNETNQIARVGLFRKYYGSKFTNVTIGFADHACPNSPLRYALAATAVGAGAEVIEKHLTLAQVMELEDFESALNPDEFVEFSETVRNCAAAFGQASESSDFGMSESEQGYRKMIRRHVVAARDLAKESDILPSDLSLKRTSSETVITDLGSVYQKRLKQSVKANTPISPTDID